MTHQDLISTAIEQRNAALDAELKMGALCKQLRREIDELKALIADLRKDQTQTELPLETEAA